MFIDMQKAPKGIDCPAGKQTLLDTARSNGASEEITNALDALPDRQYESPAAVSKAVGQEE
ncbi:DUF2795 domain-containing protein [Caballeronia sp. ATUFL_M2_KS44]|uniref:DUF2795 domain-containing protein n=1 Tax=Caballeronia sp. ATUFL_M2_KS44 TaxID=2921767 RepID=UPI0020294DBA|nr:DUF2795 domain-containing protein [Caballeronia sp. ATUFL_M2_KS44]